MSQVRQQDLSTLSELLHGAVRAVIEFVESGYPGFTFCLEGDIKSRANVELKLS